MAVQISCFWTQSSNTTALQYKVFFMQVSVYSFVLIALSKFRRYSCLFLPHVVVYFWLSIIMKPIASTNVADFINRYKYF